MKIYAVGVMQVDLSTGRITTKRLWYFFQSFQDAEKCVLENHSDIFEYYYNIALIEEHTLISPGDPEAIVETYAQWWYQATYYDHESGDLRIEQIEAPVAFSQICCVWAG